MFINVPKIEEVEVGFIIIKAERDGTEIDMTIKPDGTIVKNNNCFNKEDECYTGDFDIYLKVVDTGFYKVEDIRGQEIISIEGDYVPDFIPNDYGDYLQLEISPDGLRITNWNENRFKEKLQEYVLYSFRDNFLE